MLPALMIWSTSAHDLYNLADKIPHPLVSQWLLHSTLLEEFSWADKALQKEADK